jgi:hypothetical protein
VLNLHAHGAGRPAREKESHRNQDRPHADELDVIGGASHFDTDVASEGVLRARNMLIA